MTPQEIISDEEIARVHAHANFGAMSPRDVVDEGVRKTAVGYHCGSTQLYILLEHGLATKPRPGSSDVSLTKKGKAYARSIYCVTTPTRAEALAEGAAGDWIKRAMRFIDLCDADAGDYQDQGLHDDAERLTCDGFALFGMGTDACLADLKSHLLPVPSADDDRVRIADGDAKWLTRWLGDQKEGGHCGEGNFERRERAIWNDRIDRILAALKSTAEGQDAP
jgi:hypothetical protein